MSRCVLKDFLKCKHDDCLKTDPLQIKICPSWYQERVLTDLWAERENSRRSLTQRLTFEEKIKWAQFSPCPLCRAPCAPTWGAQNSSACLPSSCLGKIMGGRAFSGKPQRAHVLQKPNSATVLDRAAVKVRNSHCTHILHILQIFFCTTKWSSWIKSPVDDIRSRN